MKDPCTLLYDKTSIFFISSGIYTIFLHLISEFLYDPGAAYTTPQLFSRFDKSKMDISHLLFLDFNMYNNDIAATAPIASITKEILPTKILLPSLLGDVGKGFKMSGGD